MGFIGTVFASSIGFILARLVTGWFDAKFSKASYLETERNSDVERAGRLIDDITEAASNYWTTDITAILPTLQYQIPADIAELGGITANLFVDSTNCLSAVQTDLDRFDDAITAGEFGSATRSQDFSKIQAIRTCGSTLKTQIRRQRRNLPPKWFDRR